MRLYNFEQKSYRQFTRPTFYSPINKLHPEEKATVHETIATLTHKYSCFKNSMDKLFSNYTWYRYKLEGISAAMSTYFAGVLVPVGDIMASVGALLLLYVTVVEFTAMLVQLSVAGRSGEVSPVPTKSFSPS